MLNLFSNNIITLCLFPLVPNFLFHYRTYWNVSITINRFVHFKDICILFEFNVVGFFLFFFLVLFTDWTMLLTILVASVCGLVFLVILGTLIFKKLTRPETQSTILSKLLVGFWLLIWTYFKPSFY